MKQRVLVVDDEDFVRESLVDLLESEGFATVSASSGSRALEALETVKVSVVVSDLRMPGMDGLVLLQAAKRQASELPVILLTGAGTIADAVQAMKAGAFDFIQKPVDPEQFVVLVRKAVEHRDLVSEVKYLRGAVEELRGPTDMIGGSRALSQVRALIAQVAPTDATVLVTGESGVGKELVAAEVHRSSARAKGVLVRVNCAAIPENLFESEFFGHRRGAFTSAISDRAGRFAEAEGGTLALDEIGTLRPDMQAKLLRVLETGEYQVVGESRLRVADVRILSSTNEDLPARVRDGAFRKDLYYRLNVFPIHVPPLRQRREDVPLIAEHFVALFRKRSGKASQTSQIRLTKDATELLSAQEWPGNVRELKNVIERACILSSTDPIDASIFRGILASPALLETAAEANLHIRRRVDALERELISEALTRCGGKKREAAQLLGIDPKNFGYYLRKQGLSEAEEPEP